MFTILLLRLELMKPVNFSRFLQYFRKNEVSTLLTVFFLFERVKWSSLIRSIDSYSNGILYKKKNIVLVYIEVFVKWQAKVDKMIFKMSV